MKHQKNLNNLINKYKSLNTEDNEDIEDIEDNQDNEDSNDSNDMINEIMKDINNNNLNNINLLTDEEKREIHKLKLKITRYQRTFKDIPDIQNYDIDNMTIDQLKYTITEIQLTVQNYNINEMGRHMVLNSIEALEVGLNLFDIDCSGTSDILKNNKEFNSTLDEVLCEYDISYFQAYKRLLLSVIFALRTQYKLNQYSKLHKDNQLNKTIKINTDEINKYSRL